MPQIENPSENLSLVYSVRTYLYKPKRDVYK